MARRERLLDRGDRAAPLRGRGGRARAPGVRGGGPRRRRGRVSALDALLDGTSPPPRAPSASRGSPGRSSRFRRSAAPAARRVLLVGLGPRAKAPRRASARGLRAAPRPLRARRRAPRRRPARARSPSRSRRTTRPTSPPPRAPPPRARSSAPTPSCATRREKKPAAAARRGARSRCPPGRERRAEVKGRARARARRSRRAVAGRATS